MGISMSEHKPSRRRFFVSAAAAAASVTISSAQVEAALAAAASEQPLTYGMNGIGPSRYHPSFVKDVGLLQDLNDTNQGGPYWNFDTYITPVPEFYIRNAFPTPRPELDRRVDPRFLEAYHPR
jgi:hypothetical protein